ncbi:MAG: RNA methyltransferase [Bdellovibrionaceae bacterium]|nr:RNA methyltransferase [Pseudobdellovibrionaceae bacterium]
MIRIAVGLLHHPVLDRHKKVVATNITNLDVHDIARVSRVYAVEKYFVIHPAQEQLMFVARLLDHWRVGDGQRFNPMRATALTMVETASNVGEAIRNFDPDAVVIGTTARQIDGVARVSFQDLRGFLRTGTIPEGSGADSRIRSALEGRRSILLLFGTGFGMTEDVLRSCHLLLEPLKGAPPLDYRHLSVRSAVSICLDRLLGAW